MIQHDAVEVFTHMLAPASLDGMHVFSPTPGTKRHNKRRLIQPPFVALLASRIARRLSALATDWEDYAIQMLEVLSRKPRWKTPPTATRRARTTAR